MDHPYPTFNTAGLFTPGRLGPYTLPHRLLMAPMTRNRARRDGVPSPSAVIYYAQRARIRAAIRYWWLRNLWNGPYIVNGNYDQSRAIKAIADGRADFVSFDKLFLANPDLPLRFARRAPLNVPDRASFYGGDDRGYIDYPFLEEPAPALRRLVLAAGGRVEHLAFMGDRSTSPSCC